MVLKLARPQVLKKRGLRIFLYESARLVKPPSQSATLPCGRGPEGNLCRMLDPRKRSENRRHYCKKEDQHARLFSKRKKKKLLRVEGQEQGCSTADRGHGVQAGL